MMWIVQFQAKDTLRIETKYYGPFFLYSHAEDCLASLPTPAEVRCIEELINPYEDS